jgi:hypothetical protein
LTGPNSKGYDLMPYGTGEWDQEVTVTSFFTLVTPPADHATYSACWPSAHDGMCPRRHRR